MFAFLLLIYSLSFEPAPFYEAYFAFPETTARQTLVFKSCQPTYLFDREKLSAFCERSRKLLHRKTFCFTTGLSDLEQCQQIIKQNAWDRRVIEINDQGKILFMELDL